MHILYLLDTLKALQMRLLSARHNDDGTMKAKLT